MERINYTCKYFLGDRPCKPHKDEGRHCEGCEYYEPLTTRILIIKLDAIGDVLRTTSILHSLKEKYPNSQITWITREESVPLFLNNSFVDRVFNLSLALLILGTDEFDVVINLDASPISSRFATIVAGKEKMGYAYHEKGYVYPVNREAMEWFLMGISDSLKKQNKKTYQQIAIEICKLPSNSNYEPILNLTEEEKGFKRKFAAQHGVNEGGPVIGFNTGAGGRWEHKRWTFEGFFQLARLLRKNLPSCKILLYGGPEEVELNARYKEMFPEFIDTGCNNSLREFAALIDLCNILVTGDTLAMHIAIALKKQVVILFGPTSHTEIEIYGRGEKVVSPLPCICCYKSRCDFKPNCMETIESENGYEAVLRCLNTRKFH